MTPPGNTKILSGNGQGLSLKGWALLRFEITGHLAFHEVGVVDGLPLDFIVGGEFLTTHEALLEYSKNYDHSLELRSHECAFCRHNL